MTTLRANNLQSWYFNMQTIDTINDNTEFKPSGYPAVVLVGCLFLSAFLCYSQINGNRVLILACLVLFLLFVIWTCNNGMLFSVLLYFLPWSPLLKLQHGGISYFTIALLVCCVIFLYKNGFSLRIYQVIITALLVVLTLTAKLLQGNSVANNYLFFLAMLLLFPCITGSRHFTTSFWHLTLFFACGIIAAALSAQQVAGYPNILQYIKVDSYLNITRLSGYYGDPNFYCAHITACLAGTQLLLKRERKKIRQIILIILTVGLIYCGLLSASKSFIIVTALLFFVWIPILLEKENQDGGRWGLLIGILCVGAIVLSSTVFQDLLQIVDSRFASASNLAELTTGRTDLWLGYLDEFSHNAWLTILGEGYTDVTLNGRASHNTLIQGIFQFGVFGFPLILCWVFFTIKDVVAGMAISDINWKSAVLMGIGVVVPWMALDILFFDEFFLLPVYAALGIRYFSLSKYPSIQMGSQENT